MSNNEFFACRVVCRPSACEPAKNDKLVSEGVRKKPANLCVIGTHIRASLRSRDRLAAGKLGDIHVHTAHVQLTSKLLYFVSLNASSDQFA